jgi:hypothetical protein
MTGFAPIDRYLIEHRRQAAVVMFLAVLIMGLIAMRGVTLGQVLAVLPL